MLPVLLLLLLPRRVPAAVCNASAMPHPTTCCCDHAPRCVPQRMIRAHRQQQHVDDAVAAAVRARQAVPQPSWHLTRISRDPNRASTWSAAARSTNTSSPSGLMMPRKKFSRMCF
jgi:hypothetical protein